jgi:hypothetical protein
MRIDVIPRRAPHDADIRLRLGPVVEDATALATSSTAVRCRLCCGALTSNNPSSSSIGSSSSRKPWSINRSYS